MLKALNPFAAFWYTPRVEQENSNEALRTRFKIRGLNGAELGYVAPELRIDPDTRLISGMSGRGLEIALNYGLADWENFANDAGPVAYSAANFGLIPFEVRSELAMRILSASYVDPAEKKT